MEKKQPEKQHGGITHKKDMNAGSGAFNQGAEQDPDYDKGTKVSDEEKLTGHKHSQGGKEGTEEDANVRGKK
jgi:hypothetical protein